MAFQFAAFADESATDLAGQIQALKRNGYQHLEIRNIDGKNFTKLTTQEAADIANVLADNGLSVRSLGSPIGKIGIDDDFDAHMELYRHTLELAGVFGADKIRLFSFFMPKDTDPENYRNKVIDRMGVIAETAAAAGITACHENEKGIYGDVASRCLELLKTFPQMGGIFDPANFVQCGQDTWEAWQMLKPYIKYMHIKDALADSKVVPAGHGLGNLHKIVPEYLAQGGYAFTLEPHLTVFDGLGSLEREGQTSDVGSEYVYSNNDAAFDVACKAFQKLLDEVKA